MYILSLIPPDWKYVADVLGALSAAVTRCLTYFSYHSPPSPLPFYPFVFHMMISQPAVSATFAWNFKKMQERKANLGEQFWLPIIHSDKSRLYVISLWVVVAPTEYYFRTVVALPRIFHVRYDAIEGFGIDHCRHKHWPISYLQFVTISKLMLLESNLRRGFELTQAETLSWQVRTPPQATFRWQILKRLATF